MKGSLIVEAKNEVVARARDVAASIPQLEELLGSTSELLAPLELLAEALDEYDHRQERAAELRLIPA